MADEEEKQFFYHRPISVNVTEVGRMPDVRDLPASEALLIVNLKLNQKGARALAALLLKDILVDEQVDLVAITIQGTV